MVGSIANSIHNKIEQIVVSRSSLEKDRATDKKMFPVHVGSSQRNDASSLPVENAANFPQRRIGNSATCMDQERSKLQERFNVGISTDQNRNHGISRSIEGFPGLVNRKTEYSAGGMEKEKIAEKNLVSNSIAPAIDNNRGKLGAKVAASNSASTKGKNDVLGLSLDNLSSLRSKTEPMGSSIIQSRMDGIEKERFKGSGMLPHPVTSDNSKQQQHQAFIPLRGASQHPVTSEQKRNTTIFQPVQKDRNQKVDKKDEVTKGLEDKEHAAKKNKRKDEKKHNKEEEEKILEKPAMIENNKIRSFGKKDQIETLNSKPLAPHKDSSAGIRGVDETSNKRKNIKINGFIQENDARPNKKPRMVASSSQPFSGLPVKSDIILLDNKDKKINGSAKSQQLPDGNGEVSLKSPHPDSKYLEQIYSVPKMEPWLENDDDVGWLFNRCESSQQKTKSQAVSEESIPQVWAKAVRIESADVLALPYVVPF